MVQPARRETQLMKKILWAGTSGKVCMYALLGNVLLVDRMIWTTNLNKSNYRPYWCIYIYIYNILYIYKYVNENISYILLSCILKHCQLKVQYTIQLVKSVPRQSTGQMDSTWKLEFWKVVLSSTYLLTYLSHSSSLGDVIKATFESVWRVRVFDMLRNYITKTEDLYAAFNNSLLRRQNVIF